MFTDKILNIKSVFKQQDTTINSWRESNETPKINRNNFKIKI